MKRQKLIIMIGSLCLVVLLLAGLSFITACETPEPTPTPTPTPTPEPTPTPTPEPETKTLRVGALFGLSGWFSGYDTISKATAEITRDLINEQGGIVIDGDHYMIELVIEDMKSTMDGVTAGANKLVYDENIKFMISPSAFFTAATTPICEPNQVIRAQMFNTYNPGELDASTPYAFLCNDAAIEHNIANISYLVNNYPEVKTVCALVPEEQMPNLWPVVEGMLNDNGITAVGEPLVFSSSETVDFTPYATNAIASGADAIYNTSSIAFHMGALLKSLREQGSDMLLAATINASASEVMAISGEAAATNFYTIGLMPYPPGAPSLMNEVMDRYYAEYGQEAGIHLQAVNSLWIMKQAIEEAQSLDTTVVRDTWETMETFDTPFGTAYMGGLETYGIKHAIAHPNPISVLDNHEAKFGAFVDIRVP